MLSVHNFGARLIVWLWCEVKSKNSKRLAGPVGHPMHNIHNFCCVFVGNINCNFCWGPNFLSVFLGSCFLSASLGHIFGGVCVF